MVEAILTILQEDKIANDTKYSSLSTLKEEVDEQCGNIETESIETVIDEQNIHGWLQERVTIVEKRLSFVVTRMLKVDEKLLPEILRRIQLIGRQVYTSQNKTCNSAKAVYQLINDVLLDGMPCDHINEFVETEEDKVIYRQTRCIHGEHWNAVGGERQWYYDIRIAFIEGLLEETDYTLHFDSGSVYKIERKSSTNNNEQ